MHFTPSFSIALAALVTSASASALPRTRQPCPHGHAENAVHLTDNYIVTLHEDHTLEAHFGHIGVNLTEKRPLFHYLEALHAYRANLNDRLVHDLIRYDPGVVRAHQGSVYSDVSGSLDHEFNHEPDVPLKVSKRWLGDEGQWNEVNRTSDQFWHNMITAGTKVQKKTEPDSDPAYNFTMMDGAGAGVDIYIVDSGIRTSHILFEGRASNFKNLQETPYTSPKVTMDDESGHGTHVAGIAGAEAIGVAQWANIINVKISCQDPTKCNGTDDGTVSALNDIIIEHNKKKDQAAEGFKGSVINLSLGTPTSAELLGVLTRANEAGIPIAAAAGNVQSGTTGSNRIAFGPPCSNENTICVGAATNRYTVSDISAWGMPVNVWAPGEGITSTGNRGDQDYRTKTGTSMAAPQIAGFFATVMSFEGITGDAGAVMGRVKANVIANAMEKLPDIPKMTGDFFNTGIHNPDKYSFHPYAGPGVRSKLKLKARQHVESSESALETPTPTASMPSASGWKNIATSIGGESTPNVVLQEFTAKIPLDGPVETEGPLTNFYDEPITAPESASASAPASTSASPSACQGNQVASDCIAATLPSATPFSGPQAPVCMKADGSDGAPPRLNIDKVNAMISGYCQNLVSNKVVLKDGSGPPAAGLKTGEAEDKKTAAISVIYRQANCPTDKSTDVLDFAKAGVDKCVENFSSIDLVCAQDPSWSAYDKDFTLEGGVYGVDCAVFSIYGQ